MPSPPPPVRELFAQRLQRPCEIVARAPGRVNLIGEHTDYNDGFVLPMALELSTWVAAARRGDEQVRAVALDLNREATWPLDGWTAGAHADWTAYIAGIAALLRRRGARLTGCDLAITSTLPIASGLSSSAALEVSTALALAGLAGYELSPVELADLCRAAEHEFAQVPCGLMDPYVSVLARAGCAFLLDCRTRTWEHLPLTLGAYEVLIVNSGVRHKLAAGEYARRQAECRQAVEHIGRADAQVRALRDVTPETLAVHAGTLAPSMLPRARHVVSENARTQAAAAALKAGDLPELGRLMAASHASLRDDYQVSCPELDKLVDLVSAVPGVLGARMTGGGFGGCLVAIAHRDCRVEVAARIRREYDGTGHGPAQMLVSQPAAGAAVEFKR